MDLLDREALRIYEDIMDRMETANEEVIHFPYISFPILIHFIEKNRRRKGLRAILLLKGTLPMRI
jgi:hypothetical protein